MAEKDDNKVSITYKDSGVDIEAADEAVEKIKQMVKSTNRPEVMSDLGGFSGLFVPNLAQIRRPVLVSSTDGVGTKIKIALGLDKHDTIGIDLVAMCVNDIVVQGAEPLFMLDYIAIDKIIPEKINQVVSGIVAGCKQAGIALIGGETAEMPGFYPEGHYDLAGFVVGIVDDDNLIDGSSIAVGHKIIGVASSGVHANGFSLVRHLLFEQKKYKVDSYIPELDGFLGEVLLTPTKIYAKVIANLMRDMHISGMAHITGGGLIENIPRILPARCCATIDTKTWDVPPIFDFIQKEGNISETEMYRTFNKGIGLVLTAPEKEADDILDRIHGLKHKAFLIGAIEERKIDDPPIKLY